MASLADLYSKAKATARQIPANLRQSGKGLASWAVDPYGEAQRVMGEYGAMTPEQRQGLVDTAVDLFGGVDVGPVGAIKASHGSPHLFDRFDLSKISTGEGAQAYGHGLYFGEGFDSPVAMSYRASTAKGFNIPDGEKTQGIANLIAARGAEGEAMARKTYASLGENLEPTIAAAKKAIAENSHLYNVELKWPDAAREAADPLGEQHLLDWDAPLSKQPEQIQAILRSTMPKGKVNPHGLDLGGGTILDNRKGQADPNQRNPWVLKTENSVYGLSQKDVDRMISEMSNPTGENIYTRFVAEKGGQSAASNVLRELGIPGIRYLDQGYRASGTGSRNYVMFDDRFPNIVTRNGVSLTDLLRNK